MGSFGGFGGFGSKAALVMALCVVANMFAHGAGRDVVIGGPVAEKVVTFAVRELQSPHQEVKTMAAAVLLNLSFAWCNKAAASYNGWPHVTTDGHIPDMIVQLICGIICIYIYIMCVYIYIYIHI